MDSRLTILESTGADVENLRNTGVDRRDSIQSIATELEDEAEICRGKKNSQDAKVGDRGSATADLSQFRSAIETEHPGYGQTGSSNTILTQMPLSQDARTLNSRGSADSVTRRSRDIDRDTGDHLEGLLDQEPNMSQPREGLHPNSRISLARRQSNMGLADFGSRGSRATAADTKEQAGLASADIDLKATQRRSTGAGGDDPGDDDSDDDSGAGGNPFNHVGGQLPRPKSAKTPKLFADMNKLWNRLCLVPTNIHRPYQECKDVIRHGGLYHVATKVKRINEFMEREQQRVSITKILGDDFKSHLKLKYGLTSDDFVGMTMEELFPFLSAETVVADAARFYEEMENALKGTTVKTFTGVNPLNHMEFYYSQLRYIDDFRMLLSIMLTTNSQHVPSADSKEGGLVRLFCDYTDPVYARKVIASMNVRRWPNMGAFLGSYQASCLEHYDLSQTARQLPYDSYKTGTSKSDYRDRKRHEDEGAAVRDVRDDSRNSRRNPNFSPRSDPSSAPWDRARQVQFEKSKSKDRPWSKPQNRELSNTSAKVHDDDSHDPATGDESYFTRDSDYERDSEEEDRA
jgi:hypothetical protein